LEAEWQASSAETKIILSLGIDNKLFPITFDFHFTNPIQTFFMKVTVQTKTNEHGINGKPVTIKQIIDNQAVIVTPSGKKAFVDVANIKSFHGEIAFNGPDSADLTPDPEAGPDAAPAPQPAPLFPNLDTKLTEQVAADADDAVEATEEETPAVAGKKGQKTTGAVRDNY
jgi:hypothetical protein